MQFEEGLGLKVTQLAILLLLLCGSSVEAVCSVNQKRFCSNF
jgi:hypothetical protein